MALKAKPLKPAHQGVDATLFINVLGKDVFIGRIARGAVDIQEFAFVESPTYHLGLKILREGGIFGSETEAFIRRFRADKAFIGAGGLTSEGITDADSRSCWVKRAMIERSGRTILVMDSSKFQVRQFEQVCALDQIDDLVCEAAAPPDLEVLATDRCLTLHP